MSAHKKTLAKLVQKPPPADIKWQALQGALESLGYVMLNNDGSRRKFYHKEKDALICCHRPHPSPDVDKGCIADVAEHLIANGFVAR